MDDKTQAGRKFCTDCTSYDLDHTGAVCKHPQSESVDLVSGATYFRSCFLMRADTSPCGANGKLFKEL